MFRWPFRARSYLPPEEEEWHIETWRWLLDSFGGLPVLSQANLVIPTRSFFPPTDAVGHDRVLHVFEAVKKHARMANWECKLVAQARRPDFLEHHHAAAGTFSVDGGAASITYDPDLIDEPVKLVATLAHELAHYFLGAQLPPGGEDTLEPATDLTAAYLGFGVFGANVALTFEQHRDVFSYGWSSSRLGYLNEGGWTFALAVFAFLRRDTVEPLEPYLKPHLYTELRKAMAYLRREPSPVRALTSGT